MHILFLTDNFPPEANAPAIRTFEHCREWVKAGHKVTVVTGAPNFPAGKVFEGYRNSLYRREEQEGVDVVRVATYIAANQGLARRILDYASFVPGAVAASLALRGVDIVVGTSPQLFTACAAANVGRLRRIPFVFELRDLWPESIRAVGAIRHERVLDRLERLELKLYRRATSIVSVTHSFVENLASRSIDPAKTTVVTNGIDASRFHPRQKDAVLLRRLGLEGRFVVGYIGTHGLAHDLDTVLDAAARLHGAGDERTAFVFVGDGAQKAGLVARAKAEGLSNAFFLDPVPSGEVPRYLSLLDASIIHLKKNPLFRTVIPSKLFESMGMGIPVLHGVEGESAQIVRRGKVGLVFEPGNADDLCRAISRLRSEAGLAAALRANGPLAARGYDRSALAAKMLAHLEEVVEGTRADRGIGIDGRKEARAWIP